jgi:hypothetical protein
MQLEEFRDVPYSDGMLPDTSQDPMMLFVNRESRAVALEIFVKRPRVVWEARSSKKHLFVNFTVDHFIIEFSPTCPSPANLPNATKSDISRFRYVAMYLPPDWPIRLASIQWVHQWIRAFPSLVEVAFVTDDSTHELDLVNAKATLASLRSAIAALEKQEREAGTSWKAPNFRVILSEPMGFYYESQLRIEDELKHPPA